MRLGHRREGVLQESPDYLGGFLLVDAPGVEDLAARRQLSQLEGRRAGMELIVAGEHEDGKRQPAHEIAADAEDEVAAEHGLAESCCCLRLGLSLDRPLVEHVPEEGQVT